MSLHDLLHDRFLCCGEILSPETVARLIQEWEEENNFPPIKPADIRATVRSAAESFVDSMVQNEYDTPQRDDERAKRVAHWEAMRPSVQRRKEIEKALT